ncbi:MAG: nascent polypeptide-associated complex protein [Deltaproteobacteria bacterium]|nr:nascent polypeptide-associated complex protein [Deltaproteobacteria bacterium]
MKINPKQLEKMAKQMGIQTAEIEAEEVIIKTKKGEIIITNPQVSKVNMMGQDTFQISGDIEERDSSEFSEEDLRLVIEQTGATPEEAAEALEETGDIAQAILKLKK